MLISTKGRYALRLLVDVAQHQPPKGLVPLRDVAQRQDISEKYLESIAKLLVRSGFLSAQRGKGGGYRLAKPAEACSVKDIISLVEGPLVPVSCLDPGAQPCPRSGSCCTHSLWRGLEATILTYLDRFTLADLMGKDQQGYDYVI